MIIEFGRWRLVPVDSLNWELHHLHVATRGKNVGSEQWNRLGRYYSYNTVQNAVMFASDHEMREGEDVTPLANALHEYRDIVGAMVADVRAAMGGAA